jgi:8-oxo-dGTP pyrophosphatase MutT (NUDIX family)
MSNELAKLLDLLRQCQVNHAAPEEVVTDFERFISKNKDCCERSLPIGHLTGSAWLVSKDGERALLMHHRKLNRWLQPGGHADGSADLAQVSLREAEEETGLLDLIVQPEIFDLDRHLIPARGLEKEHFHYDVRFIVRATESEEFVQNEESLALAWFDIKELAENSELDSSIQRMAKKWLKLDRQIHQ